MYNNGPNLLIPGFAKCGTTSFCIMLEQHPKIFFPTGKEPGSLYDFSIVPKWWNIEKDKITINEYEKAFYKYAYKYTYLADATQAYTFSTTFCKNIVNTKIILLIREQISRLISLYLFTYPVHLLSFNIWLTKYFNDKDDINAFLYYDKINVLCKNTHNSILVINNDLLLKNSQYVLNKVFDFLNIERIKIIPIQENITPLLTNKQYSQQLLRFAWYIYKPIRHILYNLGLYNFNERFFFYAKNQLYSLLSLGTIDDVNNTNYRNELRNKIPERIKKMLEEDYIKTIELCKKYDIYLGSV